MSATVFENNLDVEIHLTLNGRLKAVMSPGDTITIDIPAGARVGYGAANTPVTAQPALAYTAPDTSGRSLVMAHAAATVPGQGGPGFRPQAAKAPRPITQYKDGVKVQTLHSVQSASRVAGVQYYDFLKALRSSGDSGFTHNGFCYQYAADGETATSPNVPALRSAPTEKRRRKSGKPVIQMALDGTPLRIWPSQSIAADELKINSSSISKVCHNQWETAGGFRWKLAKAAA
jgi:hypothetical protein